MVDNAHVATERPAGADYLGLGLGEPRLAVLLFLIQEIVILLKSLPLSFLCQPSSSGISRCHPPPPPTQLGEWGFVECKYIYNILIRSVVDFDGDEMPKLMM